jgi:hypothetical protein
MKKERFKAKASQRIDEVSAKIKELKAKKVSLQGDAKSKYEESLKELESKKAGLEAKYTELENASEEKRDEAKHAFSSASESFKEGWNKIISLFSIVFVLFLFGSCGLLDKENKTTDEDLKEEVNDVVNTSKDYTVEEWDTINAEIDEKIQKVSNEYNELNDELKDRFKSKKAELNKQKV